jgi:hypothetical protein
MSGVRVLAFDGVGRWDNGREGPVAARVDEGSHGMKPRMRWTVAVLLRDLVLLLLLLIGFSSDYYGLPREMFVLITVVVIIAALIDLRVAWQLITELDGHGRRPGGRDA